MQQSLGLQSLLAEARSCLGDKRFNVFAKANYFMSCNSNLNLKDQFTIFSMVSPTMIAGASKLSQSHVLHQVPLVLVQE